MHPTLEKASAVPTPPPFRIDYVWLRVGEYVQDGCRVSLSVSGQPIEFVMEDPRQTKAIVEALDAHFHSVGASIEHAKERRQSR
jgi:hypothetical protein